MAIPVVQDATGDPDVGGLRSGARRNGSYSCADRKAGRRCRGGSPETTLPTSN